MFYFFTYNNVFKKNLNRLTEESKNIDYEEYEDVSEKAIQIIKYDEKTRKFEYNPATYKVKNFNKENIKIFRFYQDMKQNLVLFLWLENIEQARVFY